jgi:hypothetical protein
MNRVRQAATIWSDADLQKASEQLEHGIHQVTPAKGNVFDNVIQYDMQQQSETVGTNVSGPRSTFTNNLA